MFQSQFRNIQNYFFKQETWEHLPTLGTEEGKILSNIEIKLKNSSKSILTHNHLVHKCDAEACNFTKSITPPWVFFT